uniref:Thioredoxin-like fold domain-containing protein n=1 Tax=Meloidogyne javanica TaxID=6303 RepID=A0A915MFL8_MELJA
MSFKPTKGLLIKDWKQDVIYLVQVPRTHLIPSPSPFALKLETWIRMNGLTYRNVSNEGSKGSSKGQIPFIELNGRQFADSNQIIEHLKNYFKLSIDSKLNSMERAHLRAYTILIEESLLGDKPFLFGSTPTTLDAVLFGLLAQFTDTPIISETIMPLLEKSTPNLLAFVSLIKKRYWPDWNEITEKLLLNPEDAECADHVCGYVRIADHVRTICGLCQGKMFKVLYLKYYEWRFFYNPLDYAEIILEWHYSDLLLTNKLRVVDDKYLKTSAVTQHYLVNMYIKMNRQEDPDILKKLRMFGSLIINYSFGAILEICRHLKIRDILINKKKNNDRVDYENISPYNVICNVKEVANLIEMNKKIREESDFLIFIKLLKNPSFSDFFRKYKDDKNALKNIEAGLFIVFGSVPSDLKAITNYSAQSLIDLSCNVGDNLTEVIVSESISEISESSSIPKNGQSLESPSTDTSILNYRDIVNEIEEVSDINTTTDDNSSIFLQDFSTSEVGTSVSIPSYSPSFLQHLDYEMKAYINFEDLFAKMTNKKEISEDYLLQMFSLLIETNGHIEFIAFGITVNIGEIFQMNGQKGLLA